MSVTFTATPEPDDLPPRVRLDFATTTGRAFTALQVSRDGSLLRSQPPIGSQASVLFDYDAPFGVASTYEVVGSDSGFTTVRDETWASLSGWTTQGGTPAVSGGKLTAGSVYRAIGAGSRITLHNAATMDGVVAFNAAAVPSGFNAMSIFGNLGPTITISYGDGNAVEFAPGTGDVVISGNTITTSLGTFALPEPVPAFASVIAQANSSAGVPGFKVEATTPVTFDLTATTTLDPVAAWLIHPINPDLSIEFDNTPTGTSRGATFVRSESGADTTYAAQRTLFNPIARSRPVVVTNANRVPAAWTLVVRTSDETQRQAVLSLLNDQSPVLLRVPPGLGWDLAQGWYSVDDVADNRVTDRAFGSPHALSLPLTPVDEPVLVQGAQWTYADDLIHDPTYSASLATLPTYLDRLIGIS